MKRTITQLTALCAFLLLGTITYAQCTSTVYIKNASNDDWTISYYNNDITVPAQTDATLGFFNADPTIGRGALLTSNPNGCSHKFQTNPDTWNPSCALGTQTVYYEATLDLNGCYNDGFVYIF